MSHLWARLTYGPVSLSTLSALKGTQRLVGLWEEKHTFRVDKQRCCGFGGQGV